MSIQQPDHHPDYGTSLDGDVYCKQCHNYDYTDEDDGLCDRCREQNSKYEPGVNFTAACPSCGKCSKYLNSTLPITTQCAHCQAVIDIIDGGFGAIQAKLHLDFHVANHGSIFILTGLTEACREWLEENIGDEHHQRWGKHGHVIEHRYIEPIVIGLQNEGFIGS